MSRPDIKRLEDILDAGAEVAEIVAEGHDIFMERSVNRRALERLLLIIGEAARALSAETRADLSSVDWSGVIGMRTFVTHEYFRVANTIIWNSASTAVPALVDAVRDYLRNA